MLLSHLGSDTGSGSVSSAPDCTIFAVKKSVNVFVPDCVDGPDYDYCPDDMQEYDEDVLDHGLVFIDTNMTHITSIRESLEAGLQIHDIIIHWSIFLLKNCSCHT